MHRWQALMYFLYSCRTCWPYITLYLNWAPSLEVDWVKREYQHQDSINSDTQNTRLLLNFFSCTDERHACTFYKLVGPYTNKLQYKKVWQLVTYLVKRVLLLRGQWIESEYFNHMRSVGSISRTSFFCISKRESVGHSLCKLFSRWRAAR
jgi:hypothetical protein